MDKLLNTWTATLAGQSEHTARAYRYAVGQFLDAVGKPVAEVTVADAAGYLAELGGSGLARSSVALHVSAVRSFLRWCQGMGVLPRSPLDVLRRPRVSVTSLNRYVTLQEAKALLEGAKEVGPSAHLAVAIMLLTGARVAEVAGLEWRHVFEDMTGGRGLLIHGKGNKERHVGLRDDLWALLVADRERRGLDAGLSAKDRTPLVVTSRGTAPTTRTIGRWVKQAAELAGLTKPVSPHWLRHTAATLMASGGADAYGIKQALGHADLNTSVRYVHLAQGLGDSAVHRSPLTLC